MISTIRFGFRQRDLELHAAFVQVRPQQARPLLQADAEMRVGHATAQQRLDVGELAVRLARIIHGHLLGHRQRFWAALPCE